MREARATKNDGNEVVDDSDLQLDLELTERVEVDDETLPCAEEDRDCPERTEVDEGVQSDIPFTIERTTLTERTCAIAITVDVSFKIALTADCESEHKNKEFLWKQRPGVVGMIALLPIASQIPGKYPGN